MLCSLCSNECQIIDTPKRKFYNCPKCDFIFVDDIHIVSQEIEKARYLNHNNNFENLGYVNMFEDFLKKTFNNDFTNIKTALDYGCGTEPVLAKILNTKGVKTEYYDPYFFPKKIFINKKYDLIISTEVIEHIREPLKIFDLFSNHINSNGKLALMTYFHPRDKKQFLNWWYIQDITHISFYSEITIKFIAEKFGFKFLWSDGKNKILFSK